MKSRRVSALLLLAVLASMVCVPRAIADTVLVPFGPKTAWRYLDDGSDPEPGWRDESFDDQSWRRGPAPLGYGDAGIATPTRFGNDPQRKHFTTYFRHRFQVEARDDIGQLQFRIRSDDGIAVFLNGKEVLRNNLPAGEIGRATAATQALNDLDERLCRQFRIPGDALRFGDNTLAVELHQADPASSDLYLDLELRGYGLREAFRPVVKAEARSQTETFLKGHRIAAGEPILDGYMDGGRNATLSADGLVASGREVIVVDRSRDELLRKHLAFAESEPLETLPPLDRAAVLAVYVDRVMSHVAGRRALERADRLLVAEYHGEPVLLGDVPRLCGSGVCRHRSLLFKILGDAAGLSVALVRGGVGTGDHIGAHAWNELRLDDATVVIVDAMALPELPFRDVRTEAGGRYRDVGDMPIYGSQGSPNP